MNAETTADNGIAPGRAGTRTQDSPVILFDGVCNLCERSVRWVIERDPEAIFRFAPLQSEFALGLIKQHEGRLAGFDPAALNSFIVVAEDGIYLHSDAWLYVVSRLPGPSRWLRILRWVPAGLRDRVYAFVGSRRYRWFGKKEQCMLPTEDIEARFIRMIVIRRSFAGSASTKNTHRPGS